MFVARIASILVFFSMLAFVSSVNANCVCRCSSGKNRPFCSNTTELPPICAPVVCPITPPSITPIQQPQIPPIGTRSCSQQQVLNPYSKQYEWRSVCR